MQSRFTFHEFGTLKVDQQIILDGNIITTNTSGLLMNGTVIGGSSSGITYVSNGNFLDTTDISGGNLAFFTNTSGNKMSNTSLFYYDAPYFTGVAGTSGGLISTNDGLSFLYIGDDNMVLGSETAPSLTLTVPGSQFTLSSTGTIITTSNFSMNGNVAFDINGNLTTGSVFSNNHIIYSNNSIVSNEGAVSGIQIFSTIGPNSASTASLYMGADATNNATYISASKNGANLPILLNGRGGNVGINTTSPNYTLDVFGNSRISNSLTTGSLYSTFLTTTNIVGTNISVGILNLTGTLNTPIDINLQTTNSTTAVTTSNLQSGILTTFTSSLATQGSVSFTVNNTLASSTKPAIVNIINYAGTQGIPYVYTNTMTNGFAIVINNLSTTAALNGILKINYNSNL